MAAEPETLPYNWKKLTWDAQHHFNAQNKYSYSGKGRKLADPVLQCDLCENWFHVHEVGCVSKEDNFVAFQRNYRFSCRICTGGAEQFELQTNAWTSIVLTAIYNLLLAENGQTLEPGKWVKVRDIVAWIQEHWGSLALGRNVDQLLQNNAVSKCLLYTQNSGLFSVSDDRSEVLLRHVAPSKLLLKPLVSSAVPGAVPVGGKPKKGDTAERGGGNKRKRGAGSKAGAKDATTTPALNLEQIKLPEKYKLLPVPKTEAASAQDPTVVQLSRTARAPQITLREDSRGAALTAVGYKGYRMVRATHGVASGAWYYEVKVLESQNGEDGHTRIGWSTEAGDVQVRSCHARARETGECVAAEAAAAAAEVAAAAVAAEAARPRGR